MKKIIVSLIVTAFLATSVNAQAEVNSFKYVIVPLQYKFLKGQNKYRLNTLTKQLFLKSGYEVYYDNQLLPDDVFEDRCLAMYADVNEIEKGFRVTNLEIELKNCKGKVILKSDLGTSGINIHEDRYQTALRNAYETFSDKLYYQETGKSYETQSQVAKTEVKKDNTIVEKPNVSEVLENKNRIETLSKEESADKKTNTGSSILYAQKIENGFQLVNQEPKIVMILLKTALSDVYLVKGEDAIVFKKEDIWVQSKIGTTGPETKTLNIKF